MDFRSQRARNPDDWNACPARFYPCAAQKFYWFMLVLQKKEVSETLQRSGSYWELPGGKQNHSVVWHLRLRLDCLRLFPYFCPPVPYFVSATECCASRPFYIRATPRKVSRLFPAPICSNADGCVPHTLTATHRATHGFLAFQPPEV